MKLRFFLFAGAASALIGSLAAGTLELQPKETAPPTITESAPWQFTIAVPGWLASANGTIGINGVDANIDIPVTEILQHFDLILPWRVVAQKGPFGIYGDSFYMGVSDVAEVNGMINNIHETMDLFYLDGGLSWRFINQPRWSLDFAAGTHYTNVYEQLTLNDDPVLIHQTSQQFVTNISDDLIARLNNDISGPQFFATLTSTVQAAIVNQIDPHGSLDRHQSKPNIPIGPLGGHIPQDVAKVVQDFIHIKVVALQARIDALHLVGDARRAAVSRIVSAVQAQIADELAATLDTKFNQTISRDDYFFDPYVGLYGRYDFNRTYYTALRGQIGGFGVGADLMWQVEGVIGVNLHHNIFTEIGYRALGINYENNRLLFNMVLHGPEITTGITF